MQDEDPIRERLDVRVFLGIPPEFLVVRQLRGVRTADAARGGSVAALSRRDPRVSRRVPQVGTSPGRDRRNDFAQTVPNLRPRDATGPVGRFLEDAVPPDVLGERPRVVDVLKPLADGVVAEPFADRLRGVPAVDEFRACGPQPVSCEHHQLMR